MNKLELYKKYKTAYYLGEPLISDEEFDKFEAELLTEYPNLRDEEIGFDDDTSLQKFEHPTKMTSLSKFNIYEDVNSTPINNIEDWLLNQDSLVTYSPKYDGNSVNVIYKNGKLWKALSRGNGTVGRDYTNKIAPHVPAEIDITEEVVEFRGEVLMLLPVFDKKYSQFKNPRNFVAGILNKKEFIEERVNDLSVEFFDVRINGRIAPENLIDKCGLRTPYSWNYTVRANDWLSFTEMYNKLLIYRTECPYYLDGFVIKVIEDNRVSTVDGNPKDCVAIKFPPTESTAAIVDIEWNVGKTGDLTPVLQLSPTLLDGTTVKRASAHNLGYVLSNGFIPGAKVTISKSGDIIPQARKVIEQSTKEYTHPTVCPICKQQLIVADIHLRCENSECDGKLIGKLSGIRRLGVEFLGGKTIEKFFEAGLTKVEDFFTDKFSVEYLTQNGDFKEGRQLEKIMGEFNRIKELDLSQLIVALQFDNAGQSISSEYAKKMAGIKYSFASMDRKAISAIDEQRVLNFVRLVEAKGIKVKFPVEEVIDTNVIKVEMTGSVNIDGIKTKAEFLNLCTNVVHTKLNKETDYLITDDLSSSSSKMKKAEKLGVKVITYSDFLNKFIN